MGIRVYLIIFLTVISSFAFAAPTPLLEKHLNYVVKKDKLEKGDFQYFYCLLGHEFENLMPEQTETPVEEILKTFLPLDTKKLWDPKDQNYLALAKFTYILPIAVQSIDEEAFTDTKYLQKTLPKYKVSRQKDGFHVAGSFITPDFHVTVRFLSAEDPLIPTFPMVDKEKIRTGKMKVSLMHQSDFGKVMIFKTAKMASALIIYEDLDTTQTLVTQFILSNVINVPTKNLIRKGMIDNLRDVVEGSRAFISSSPN